MATYSSTWVLPAPALKVTGTNSALPQRVRNSSRMEVVGLRLWDEKGRREDVVGRAEAGRDLVPKFKIKGFSPPC